MNSMTPLDIHLAHTRALTRRHFFARAGLSLGGIALGGLLARDGFAATAKGKSARSAAGPMAPKPSMIPAKAKAIIYIHLAGAPPSLDLFDYKPKLNELHMQPCPESLFKGQRFAFIKGVPKMLGSPHKFHQYGKSGAWVSDLLPHMAKVVDEMTIIKSCTTDQFNHAPAELFLFTGLQRPGYASLGSWVTYGLGSVNQDLPGFVVLSSGGTDPSGGKNLWGNGFLPGVYQGVQCRTSGEPILYANNPPGMDRESRRRSLDALRKLNEAEAKQFGDPETVTRIEQYELAYRMQVSVPEVFDIGKEPANIRELYGAKPGEGGFANNCLLARRLVEAGTRMVSVNFGSWDHHSNIKGAFENQATQFDTAFARLIRDLDERGMLDTTLVLVSSEFGRTPKINGTNGRDHYPRVFSVAMAGGGVKKGFVYGKSDALGAEPDENPVSPMDLARTMYRLIGINASKRLVLEGVRPIDIVNGGRLITELIA